MGGGRFADACADCGAGMMGGRGISGRGPAGRGTGNRW